MRKFPAMLVTGLVGIAAFGLFGGSVLASHSPIAGATFASFNVDVQRDAAVAALQAKQPALALKFARQAVEAMPYEQFGLTLASTGAKAEQQLAALNLSSALGWRDYTTNVRLVEAALRENAPIIAAQRIDALGRTQDADIAGPYADRLLALPGGAEALAERAALRGPLDWWNRYFRIPPANPEIMARRAALVRQLDPEDGAWLREAVRDMGLGFADAGAPEKGLALWRDTLAQPAEFQGLVYDGNFALIQPDRPVIGGEWRIDGNGTPLNGGGLALELAGNAKEQQLSQHLALQPGSLQLSVQGETESGSVRGLNWVLRCQGAGRLPLQAQAGTKGPIGRWSVSVPQDCKTGFLTLVSNGRNGQGDARLLLRSVSLGTPGAGADSE